jgi:predicted amidohydrolase
MKITVAAIQLKPLASIEANLDSAAKLLQQAVDRGAQLVVLPENFAYYGQSNIAHIGQLEANPYGPVRQFLAEQAKKLAIWLVAGTLPVADKQAKPYARSYLFNPLGEVMGVYDKIHLFDADVRSGAGQTSYKESNDYLPGQRVAVVPTELATLGLSVCYDLRFAELYRQLADRDAEIIAVPAAFTTVTGRDHWQLLLRARAVENQVFVIGANMVDRDHAVRGLWGGSAIIDPWGNVLASLDDQPGVVVVEIDTQAIAATRAKMPVSQHRKL